MSSQNTIFSQEGYSFNLRMFVLKNKKGIFVFKL